MSQDYLHIGRASDIDLKSDRRFYRLFEIVPGLISWLTLVLIPLLSFFIPVYVAIFIIVFDIYWFLKTFYLSLHLRVAYSRLRENMKTDWRVKLDNLDPQKFTINSVKSWREICHIVFLPAYKEDYAIISASLDSLVNSNYPKENMVVVLCWEERGGESTRQTISKIEADYSEKFSRFFSIMHPDNIKGEIPGKGSNAAYAAKVIKENYVDARGISYDKIIVSNFDIDTVVSKEYFGVLTHAFLTTKDPLRSSYQPIPLYINNIWEAPSFARVVAFSATFWHTIKQEKSETATTFSSHSMPWQALVDVGFWQKNMVSEDSRIFWQSFLRYDGDYKITPLFYPVSMDANVASTTWQTFKNIYKQQRRWAFGAENIPYFLFGFMKNKKIPRHKKWHYGFMVIEGNHSWATNALIIFLLGWLPVIIGGPEFNQTVLSFNLPHMTRIIMTLAMVGLISSAVLSINLLPPRPIQYGKHKYMWMILQWLMFPVTTIFLGTIPAIDAQTRLMFGKYLGFWLTPKIRK